MGQTGLESDSDSGMGSPAQELLTETTATKKEELNGEGTLQYTMIKPNIGLCNYRLVTFM